MISITKCTKLVNFRLKNNTPKYRKFVHTFTPEAFTAEIKFSNGRNLKLSTGQYARFANATAVSQMGDTAVMVTAVAKAKPTPGTNFMPLVVDYRLKGAASGRIPMNFMRRELGPSEKEILSGRLIDRSVRPLFPAHFRTETQLACNMLAMDSIHVPDVLAINSASLALSLSDIPWNGPIGAVRVGLLDGEVLINPTRRELQDSQLDLVVTAAKHNLVVMLEGKGNVVLMQDLLKAIKQGTREAQFVIHEIERLQKAHGRVKRALEDPSSVEEEIKDAVKSMSEMRLREIFQDDQHDKISRDMAVNEVRTNVIDKVWSSYPNTEPALISEEFNSTCKQIFRNLILEENKRCDGRELDQLRNIKCEVIVYLKMCTYQI